MAPTDGCVSALKQALAIVALALPTVAPAAGASYPPPLATSLDVLASGLDPLSGLTHAGDERLFVVTLDGRVLLYADGAVRAEPFLDLRSLVSTDAERGLLGLAFHPRFAENGLFFVSYTNHAFDVVIARYRAAIDGERAEPGSGVILLTIENWGFAHYSGQLQFGPDGYLYASAGTGPWGGDGLCSGQRLDSLRGKLLRLDVDAGADTPPYYSIPPSNPFAGGPAPEVWAYGLRNAWRFSFDRGSGDLYIADVGEDHREEIDRQPASSPGGENYGWARMEGTYCAELVAPCLHPVPPCGDPAFTDPILEHEHVDGFCAVIGGFVYRGAEIAELEGRYVYGDYCSGRLYAARQGPGGWSSEALGLALPRLTSLGEDAGGELHLVTADGVLARLSAWPGAVSALCVPAPRTLCFGGGRFRAAARWADARGGSGIASAVTLSADSGYFWFSTPSNVELLIKLLDGCGSGLPATWVFAAGLTNLEIDLRVTDTLTGAERRYQHAGGSPLPPIQDTGAFPCH
jgi:glucose/arabinose dehydrogenase